MTRFIYFWYGIGSTAIFVLSLLINYMLFQKTSFLLAYLLSSVFLFYATVKRLQDINQSGLKAFLMFIPLVKQLFFLYLLFPRGTDGDNAYGADPLSYLKSKPMRGLK